MATIKIGQFNMKQSSSVREIEDTHESRIITARKRIRNGKHDARSWEQMKLTRPYSMKLLLNRK